MEKRKLIRQILLFLVSYGFMGVLWFVISAGTTMKTGEFYMPTMSSGYYGLVVLLVAIYFLPLALKIYRGAKELGWNFIKYISMFVIATFGFALVMSVIAFVVYLVNPGFFAG